MKKFIYNTLLAVSFMQVANAQDSVQYRIILIGDAGEMSVEQKAVMLDAAQKNIPGKTIAVFLGDNVYPKGMELTGTKGAQESRDILRSQYESLRKAGIPVYFVPGNHDWDKSGPTGYQKMLEVNKVIRDQNDSLLQSIPADACPGPFELNVSDNVTVVAMDSEWWLYPFSKPSEVEDCDCKTKRDVLGKLNDILQRNKNKIVFFVTHHPFNTYGSHGGYYTFKDHIFPLTNLHKNLYIPLPIIGSLYPALRKAFPPSEDLKNILYSDMIKSVDDILKLHPNIIHAAGHEHDLQLIQGAVLEVGSGAGSKHTPVRMGKGSLFARPYSGYVVADVLRDNSVRLTYRVYVDGAIRDEYVYNKPHTNVSLAGDLSGAAITGDSIKIKLNNNFDKVTRAHRNLFGENYRKIWALETTIPVLRISDAHLTPKELGGGMQTHSLRLADNNKKEWVLRSIEKFPDNLLPKPLANTLAADILKDNSTAAFPYAPLTVPVFADALGVPHSNPKVVYIAPDKNLGIYSRDFANSVSIFEEREPLGKSLSTIKMLEKLKDDNDNMVDQHAFFTARLLDIFLGDWDRHADQWRWIGEDNGKGKTYKPVPRDRDQVYYVNQGFFPKVAALPWIMPKFQGFGGNIRNINTFVFNARLIDGIFTNDLSYEDWVKSTRQMVTSINDTVIDAALRRLPQNVYDAAHEQLARQFNSRKNDMLAKMPVYYRFLNKIIDVSTSDKRELVKIKDTLNGQLAVNIYKISKEDEVDKLIYSRVLDPGVTKEIRLFLLGGNDSVVINNQGAPVKVRIVGDAAAAKHYDINGSNKYLKKIHIYEGTGNASFTGEAGHVHLHLSNDPANTGVQVTNRYNKTIPLLNIGYNVDDGLIFGGGVRFIKQGFRKQPYASSQQITFAHSFSTNAFQFIYKGEWLNALGKADFLLLANALAPDNTQNFFGRGNETGIDKTGDYKRFYRARFSLYNVAPAFRWRSGAANSITIAPTLQYYRFDPEDNAGRFITNTTQIHSYDSATIAYEKVHAGLVINLIQDTRNNTLMATSGSYINMRIQGYDGLNDHSKSFGQITTDLAVYKSLGQKSNIVIAERIGGGVTAGKTTFYQSLFLGGHENLWGYHQYRFAGEHLVYNNLEARIRLANISSYVLPGQLGIVGFYDIGKVWEKGYNSSEWHQGAGGGVYFAPAQIAVFQLVVGGSKEGVYPYFTMGFRF